MVLSASNFFVFKTKLIDSFFYLTYSIIYSDNPDVDIYGANLFNIFLQAVSEEVWTSVIRLVNGMVQKEHPCLFPHPVASFEEPQGLSDIGMTDSKWISLIQHSGTKPEIIRELVRQKPRRRSSCFMEPILVMSGVYQVCFTLETSLDCTSTTVGFTKKWRRRETGMSSRVHEFRVR